VEEGRLQIDGVGEGAGERLDPVRGDRPARLRLAADRRQPGIVHPGLGEQLVGRCQKGVGQGRVEGPPPPAPDGGCGAPGLVREHGRAQADGREPCRRGDRVARQAAVAAAPVPALEHVEQRRLDRARQPQAAGDGGADLAVRVGPFRRGPLAQRRRPGHGAQPPGWPKAAAHAGDERRRLAGAGHVDHVAAGADGDVVAAHQGRDLVRRRGASDRPQERGVVDVRHLGRGKPQTAGEARRDQARAGGLVDGVAAGEVAHRRERPQELRQADGFAGHRAMLQAAPPGRCARIDGWDTTGAESWETGAGSACAAAGGGGSWRPTPTPCRRSAPTAAAG
jgi:hypothetical protein